LICIVIKIYTRCPGLPAVRGMPGL